MMAHRDRPGTDEGTRAPAARRRTVSAEEAALFRAAMKDAAPLAGVAAPPRAEPAASPAPKSGARPPPSAPAARSPASPPLRPNVPVDLDSRTMDRLRRGRMRPEAVLDLHGMTLRAAHAALEAFLADAQAGGRRCVMVVTGKGRAANGGGAIRAELPHWLNLDFNRTRVLGFAQAQPRDGGGGAFYVLLRRVRRGPS